MIRIIDYKAGNAPSVLRACEKLGKKASYASTPDDLQDAAHIILPGVGSARATIDSLNELGLTAPLNNLVINKKIPFLGICVGLQILFEHSEEGDTPCLGWLKGHVVKFNAQNARVPQMGWNKVNFVKNTLNAKDGYFYFVNSYYALPKDETVLWGVAEYGGARFAACVCKDNIYAAQFHIEKSAEAGLELLSAFLSGNSIEGAKVEE